MFRLFPTLGGTGNTFHYRIYPMGNTINTNQLIVLFPVKARYIPWTPLYLYQKRTFGGIAPADTGISIQHDPFLFKPADTPCFPRGVAHHIGIPYPPNPFGIRSPLDMFPSDPTMPFKIISTAAEMGRCECRSPIFHSVRVLYRFSVQKLCWRRVGIIVIVRQTTFAPDKNFLSTYPILRSNNVDAQSPQRHSDWN